MLIFEIGIGIFMTILGFFMLFLSLELVWIQIYPPPFEKTLIESTPIIFWIIGFFLFADVLRKQLRNSN